MLPPVVSALSQLTTDVSLTSVARGDVLYRGASKWNNLAAGTSGHFLKSNGAGADPSWAAASASPAGSSGQLQYNNAGAFGGAAALAYATSGTLLTVTAGAATDIPIGVVAHASQSANLQEWRNSSGTVKANVNSTGGIYASGTQTETADATNTGVYLGFAGGTPRTIWKDSNSVVAQIDLNYSATNSYWQRHIVGGTVRMLVGRDATASGGVAFEKCIIGATDNLSKLDSFIRARVVTGNTAVRAFVGLGETGQTAAMFAGQLYSSTSTVRDAWENICTWATSTDASRKARATFNIYDTAAREGFRIEASGSAPMIGFLGASAVIRQATTGTTTGFTAGSGTAVLSDSTFTGNTGSTAYTIGDIILALKNYGLLAA